MNKYLFYIFFSAIVHTQLYSQKIIISPEKLNEKAQKAYPNSLEKQKVFSLNYLVGIEYFRIESKHGDSLSLFLQKNNYQYFSTKVMSLVHLDSTAQVTTILFSKNTPICFQESFKEVFNKAFHRLNLTNDKDWISKFKNKSLLFTTSIGWSISEGSINYIQNSDDIMKFKDADDILLNVVIVPENFIGRTF